MMEREPPKLALWLLKCWGSPYHRESLAGDLIEQYAEGQSKAWCWKQVTVAILAARGRSIRAMPWSAICRLVSRLFAEIAAVLALALVVDQARRTHSLAQMMTETFIGTLAVLLTMAMVAVLVSTRTGKRKRTPAAINALMLVFGVLALGLGTITWADTLRAQADPVSACSSDH
jgi:hypothetical protein